MRYLCLYRITGLLVTASIFITDLHLTDSVFIEPPGACPEFGSVAAIGLKGFVYDWRLDITWKGSLLLSGYMIRA